MSPSVNVHNQGRHWFNHVHSWPKGKSNGASYTPRSLEEAERKLTIKSLQREWKALFSWSRFKDLWQLTVLYFVKTTTLGIFVKFMLLWEKQSSHNEMSGGIPSKYICWILWNQQWILVHEWGFKNCFCSLNINAEFVLWHQWHESAVRGFALFLSSFRCFHIFFYMLRSKWDHLFTSLSICMFLFADFLFNPLPNDYGFWHILYSLHICVYVQLDLWNKLEKNHLAH